jgi:UDP-3-O-acyl-N-acetylglucosamine deacetylase
MLDVIGDLALTGCEVIGHVIAHRSGHALHAELAKKLLEQAEAAVPQYDANQFRRAA